MKNRLFVLVLCLALVLAAAATAEESAFKGSYLMGTGSATGNYYNFGNALCTVVNSVTGANLTVNATGGSTENARLMASGDNEFAIIQSDVYSYALNGIELFDGYPVTNLTAITACYPEMVQIIVRKDSGISNVAEMKGKSLKAKRNHVNKFLSEHADFRYCELEPRLFDECRSLAQQWRTEVDMGDHEYNITANAEQQAMETVFNHWDALGTRGGCIYVDGRMVAFTYGAAVTHDTFDVCVEKADRNVDGAFNIINQQFAAHLPEEFVYLNREEDMGLEGLRKSKLSYHPHILLSYNNVIIRCR